MEMATSVTPCRLNAGATVLDEHRQACARGSAVNFGGDVECTYQVSVPLNFAVRTRELAGAGFGDTLPAGWTGRGGTTLIHQSYEDPRLFGLIAEGLQKMSAAPPAKSEVLYPTHIPIGDPAKVTNSQGADPLLEGEGDHLTCGLMLSLMYATTMARFGSALLGTMASPTPGSMLPWPRGMTGRLGLPCLLIL